VLVKEEKFKENEKRDNLGPLDERKKGGLRTKRPGLKIGGNVKSLNRWQIAVITHTEYSRNCSGNTLACKKGKKEGPGH